jgi:hypothetical protein
MLHFVAVTNSYRKSFGRFCLIDMAQCSDGFCDVGKSGGEMDAVEIVSDKTVVETGIACLHLFTFVWISLCGN